MLDRDIILIELLSAAMRKKTVPPDQYNSRNIDWNELFFQASEHQVHTLIYPVVKMLDTSHWEDQKLLPTWHMSVMARGIQMISDELWLGEVLEGLEKENIQALVLKGMVVNKCYPYPELRTMGDADILVHEADIERAAEVFKDLGYLAEKDKKTKHIEFFKQGAIAIELHRQLIEYDFMKEKDSFHQEIWDRPEEVYIGKTKALALNWEMQVLHLCVHMAAHISYGGFGLRQLCDLLVVVETKGDKIDWNIIRDRSIKYGVDQFIQVIFLVCHRLFGMVVPPELAIPSEMEYNKIDRLIEDILLGGNYGNTDIQRTSANVLISNSTNLEALAHRNKLLKTLQILFPNRELLSKRAKYLYVKKNPLLLPIAWLHRIYYGLRRKDFDFDEKKSLFRDDNLIRMARDRNNLLEWLRLR